MARIVRLNMRCGGVHRRPNVEIARVQSEQRDTIRLGDVWRVVMLGSPIRLSRHCCSITCVQTPRIRASGIGRVVRSEEDRLFLALVSHMCAVIEGYK